MGPRRARLTDPHRGALKTALRATLVVPALFAVCTLVLDNRVMTLFAAFGSVVMVGLVGFDGPRRSRLAAYLGLAVTGVVLTVIGTPVSSNPALAAATTAVVVFVVLFCGIANHYVAAGGSAALMVFVIAVMIPAPVSAIPDRLAGLTLAAAAAIPVALFLWPARPHDRVRARAVQACRALAGCVAAGASADPDRGAAARDEARQRVDELRDELVSATYRPSGATGRTAALARLVADTEWIVPFLPVPSAPAAGRGLPGEPTAELGAAVAQVLDAGAATLEGGPDRPDLDRLARARAAVWETLDDLVGSPAATAGDDDALAAAVDEAFRLRLLSYGTAHIGVHCLMASGLAAPDPDRVAGFDTTGAPPEGPDGGAGPGSLRPALAAARREAASHLTTRSVWFRNSVRAAAALSVAVLVAQLAEVQHGFWVALGTLAVLRSSVSGTATNVAWAMAGTVAGIAVGGARSTSSVATTR